MPETDDPPDSADKKVKDLIDAATRAELEHWFGLPSFEQLAERGIEPRPPEPTEDPEVAALHKRRAEAIAAVDPTLLEALRRRVEPPHELVRPRPPVKLNVDPSISRVDLAMIDRVSGIAEPREIERPEVLSDDLRDATPQALLRDLHRPELYFDKQFEVVDMIAEYRQDVAAVVAEVMTTPTRLPPPGASSFQQAHALLLELRAERRQPWTEIKMPLRQVTE
ncbi:MAG TPA: hypothetical protein VF469_18970 [Kofleriaceae bacterium]